jgi:hypothetical protein
LEFSESFAADDLRSQAGGMVLHPEILRATGAERDRTRIRAHPSPANRHAPIKPRTRARPWRAALEAVRTVRSSSVAGRDPARTR